MQYKCHKETGSGIYVIKQLKLDIGLFDTQVDDNGLCVDAPEVHYASMVNAFD